MQKNILILSLAVLMLFGFSPSAQAYIEEPIPIQTGTRMYVVMNAYSPVKPGTFESRGTTQINVDGSLKGCANYVQLVYTPETPTGDGLVLIHPSVVDQWVDELNGNREYVHGSEGIDIVWNKVIIGANTYHLVHIRDLAELCGMHWYNSVHWN